MRFEIEFRHGADIALATIAVPGSSGIADIPDLLVSKLDQVAGSGIDSALVVVPYLCISAIADACADQMVRQKNVFQAVRGQRIQNLLINGANHDDAISNAWSLYQARYG